MDANWASTKISRIFGGRYELEKIISEGAHFLEGVGTDVITSQKVGLTVFAPCVNDHEDNTKAVFQAARELSAVEHVNICSPSGWSETDDCLYVAFDRVDGVNLAQLLESGVTLSASQTLVLALEVTRALQHCHSVGITHGDLRPDNIWIGLDQRVHVSGFGLARAVFHIPAPEVQLIEANRYASPERSQGQMHNSASDIYALALIIREVLTGQTPPLGDTLVSMLMQRSEYEVDLGGGAQELGPVFGRCGAVEPSERPSAQELAEGLLVAAESLSRPAPFPTGVQQPNDSTSASTETNDGTSASTETSGGTSVARETCEQPIVQPYLDIEQDLSGAEADNAEGNSELDEIEVTAEDVAEVEAVAAALDHPSLDELLATKETIFDPDTGEHSAVLVEQDNSTRDLAASEPSGADTVALTEAARVDSDVLAPQTSAGSVASTGLIETAADNEAEAFDAPIARRGRAIRGLDYGDEQDLVLPRWPLFVLFILIAGAIAAALVYSPLLDDVAAPTAPDFVGSKFEDVEQVAEERGWKLKRLESRQDGTLVGQVLLQDPGPGKAIHRGDQFKVTVSLGNEMVELPSDIFGLTVEQAQIRLNDFGIIIDSTREVNSEALSAGLVVAYDEPTNQKPAGESVKLVVSAGPKQRVVPDNIIGMTQEDATDLLSGMRLIALPEPVFDPDAKEGSVLQVEPSPGIAVAADSEVKIFVSAGPEPVEIPDVVGMSLEEAITAIQELGLFFTGAEGTAGEPAISTIPDIGEIVDVGTEVTIVLGEPETDDEDNGDSSD